MPNFCDLAMCHRRLDETALAVNLGGDHSHQFCDPWCFWLHFLSQRAESSDFAILAAESALQTTLALLEKPCECIE